MTDEKLLDELNQKFPAKLIENLLVLPEEIKAKENLVLAYKLKNSKLKQAQDVWEINELRKISEEVDLKDGKKVYSNEMIRKAELERRRYNIVEVTRLQGEIESNDSNARLEETELNYLNNRFRAMRDIVLLISGGR